MVCGANQEYDIRASCPATCLNLNGNNDCGIVTPTEGCFCKSGFVLDSNNNCVSSSSCGCTYPDGSGVLSVSFIGN